MFSVAGSVLSVLFSNILPALLAFGGFVAVIVGVNVLIKFVVNGMGFIEGISVHGYQEAKKIYDGSQPDVSFRDSSMQEKVGILQRYIVLFGIFYLLSLFGLTWVLIGLACYAVYSVRKLTKGESDKKTLTAAERVNEAFKQARRIADTGRYVQHSFNAFKSGKEPLSPEEFAKQESERLSRAEYNIVDTDEIRRNNDEFGGTKAGAVGGMLRLTDKVKGFITGKDADAELNERLENFTVRDKAPQKIVRPTPMVTPTQDDFWVSSGPVANPLITEEGQAPTVDVKALPDDIGAPAFDGWNNAYLDKVKEDAYNGRADVGVPAAEPIDINALMGDFEGSGVVTADGAQDMDVSSGGLSGAPVFGATIEVPQFGEARSSQSIQVPPKPPVARRGNGAGIIPPFTKGVVTSLSYVLSDGLDGLVVHPDDRDFFNDLLADGYGNLIIEDIVRCDFYLDETVSKDPVTLEPFAVNELHDGALFRFIHHGGYFCMSKDMQPDWTNNIVDETKPLFRFTKPVNGGSVEVVVVQTTDQTRVVLTDACKYELYKSGYILQSPDIVNDIVAAFERSQYRVEENGLYLGNLTVEPYYMALTCQDYRGERWLHSLTKEDLVRNFSHNNVYRRNGAPIDKTPSVDDLYSSFEDNLGQTSTDKNFEGQGGFGGERTSAEPSFGSGISGVDFNSGLSGQDAEFEKFINETRVAVKPLFSVTLPDSGMLLHYWLSEDGSGVNADLSIIYDLIRSKVIGAALIDISRQLPESIILEDGTTAYISKGYQGVLGLTLTARPAGFEDNEKVIVNEFNYPSIFGLSAGGGVHGTRLDVYFSTEDYPAVMPFAYTSQTMSSLVLHNNRYLVLEEQEAVRQSAAATGIPLDEFLRAEVAEVQLYKLVNGTELYITECEPFMWKVSVKQNNSYYNIPIYRDMLPSLF